MKRSNRQLMSILSFDDDDNGGGGCCGGGVGGIGGGVYRINSNSNSIHFS